MVWMPQTWPRTVHSIVWAHFVVMDCLATLCMYSLQLLLALMWAASRSNFSSSKHSHVLFHAASQHNKKLFNMVFWAAHHWILQEIFTWDIGWLLGHSFFTHFHYFIWYVAGCLMSNQNNYLHWFSKLQ